MPQVKGLKELKVAGQATRKPVFDFFFQWHLTERCNLRCAHCYQSGALKAGDELNTPEIMEALGEASDMLESWAETYEIGFSPSFNVTGGEPLLRPDLFEVISEIRSRGFDVYLLTNGTLIDGDIARRIRSLGVKGVQVSMEGPEAVHDSIRGRGSFSRSVRGIGELLDAGLTVTMNATLSALNAEYFMDLVPLASSVGVQRLGFSRLVPSGKGMGLIGQMLPANKVNELYKEILKIDVKGLEIVTGDPLASQMGCDPGIVSHDTIPPIPLGGCAAGVSGLTFTPDGTILPCRRLDVPIGNLRKDSIREVWATSPVLEALRDKSKYGGKCGACQRWDSCRGCRAIAYAYSTYSGSSGFMGKAKGDFLSGDPQCFF